jgi:hypothetical protein
MIDKILKDLKEKHGVEVKKTPEIESLICYVSHIKYNEGWLNCFNENRNNRHKKKKYKN